MVNVLITKPFGEHLVAPLRTLSPPLEITVAEPGSADYSRTDILYGDRLPDPAQAPNLKWVQLHAAGVNGIYNHPVYTQTAISLTTASGVHAATTSEYAITVMLALVHRVPRMVEWKERGTWPPDEQRWPLFVPTELRGATIGVIGYGSIGREVARLARTFGMRVLACKRDPASKADTGYSLPGTGDPDGSLPEQWFAPDAVGEMLTLSDVVVMCAPLTAETRQMLGAKEIASMRPGAYFINVGRGATVDEAALVQALAEKRIAGAALDVFDHEPLPAGHSLYSLDNVILSPHISGFIPSYDEKCIELFGTNIRRFLEGTPLLNLVDRSKGY